MSYARFIDNDVYVYLDSGGYLNCCGCIIASECTELKSKSFYCTDDLIKHLEEHVSLGHVVKPDVFVTLILDKEENDRWIAEKNDYDTDTNVL